MPSKTHDSRFFLREESERARPCDSCPWLQFDDFESTKRRKILINFYVDDTTELYDEGF